MKRFLLVAALLCCLLAACSNTPSDTYPPLSETPPETATQTPPDVTAPDTASPDTVPGGRDSSSPLVVDERFWEKEYRADDGALLLTVSYAAPDIGADSPAAVRAHYENLESTFQRLVNETLSEAREYYAVCLNEGRDFPVYSIGQNYSVQYNGGGRLSVLRDRQLYTGGVHGISWTECDNFDLLTGARLTLGDLFTAPRSTYAERLAALVCEQIAPRAELYYEGYEQIVRENFPDEDFCLTEDGLSLFFQAYVLAPYSEGVPRFDIPRAELEDIWKS